jgi:hypothetical protein
MTIEIVRDGNAIIALIGRNLQDGISGVGDTVPEALRDLANAIEREKWQMPELDPRQPRSRFASNSPRPPKENKKAKMGACIHPPFRLNHKLSDLGRMLA